MYKTKECGCKMLKKIPRKVYSVYSLYFTKFYFLKKSLSLFKTRNLEYSILAAKFLI